MRDNAAMAKLLNTTQMRTVPMSLYGTYDANWRGELAYWRQQGMADNLGVGFCPTCNEKTPEPNIAAKFAAASEFWEIDMFAFEGGDSVLKAFEPYLPAMKAWLASPPPPKNF